MKYIATLLIALLPLPTGLAAQDGDGLVIVNGRSISRERVNRILMDAYGLEVMQQVVIAELARQASREAGLQVAAADIREERRLALDRIARDAGMDPGEATEENKQSALKTVLEQRRISMTEYLISMERNAHLRKLVETTLVVDDKTLREEFARTYGERVRIRHIQVSVQNRGRLSEVLSKIGEGIDFGEIAKQMSANIATAARGGELPPFSFTDPSIDPLMRDAAFSLELGETSNPIRTGQFYHILKLEERIPPDSIRFEDVRDEVERKLRERVIPKKMGDLAEELFRKADIRVLDAKMRVKYEDFLKNE